MKIDVVPLPRLLTDADLRDRAVVVFDVLRATTTITAALAAGAKEIRLFDSIDAARLAAAKFGEPKLLCGELKCLPPPGFDLGNSPVEYEPEIVRNKTIFLSTTNGTRALVAARHAAVLLAGALVNASAIAAALVRIGRDVTLLCAGTDGEEAPEDLLGAGAVVSELPPQLSVELSPLAKSVKEKLASIRRLPASTSPLLSFLQSTQGGKNVLAAGLHDDTRFAAQLNEFDVVPVCDVSSMTIRAMAG